MCSPIAAVGAQALQMGISNRSSAAMAEAQAGASYKSMNYALMNYEIERQDAYDAAVNEITKVRINQQQLNSQVNSAVMEGQGAGGRTAQRLMRAAEADTARTVSSIQDNYLRKSNEIDLNKEQTVLSTHDYLVNLKDSTKPNKLGDILSLAATGISAWNDKLTADAEKKVLTGGGDGVGTIEQWANPGWKSYFPQVLAPGFTMFAGTSDASNMLASYDKANFYSNFYDSDGNLLENLKITTSSAPYLRLK